MLLRNDYALCIMNYALKEAHGWVPATTTWFHVVFLFTVGYHPGWVPTTTTWFHMVFLLTVGYHPRLGSRHRYAVLSGCLATIMHYALK